MSPHAGMHAGNSSGVASRLVAIFAVFVHKLTNTVHCVTHTPAAWTQLNMEVGRKEQCWWHKFWKVNKQIWSIREYEPSCSNTKAQFSQHHTTGACLIWHNRTPLRMPYKKASFRHFTCFPQCWVSFVKTSTSRSTTHSQNAGWLASVSYCAYGFLVQQNLRIPS